MTDVTLTPNALAILRAARALRHPIRVDESCPEGAYHIVSYRPTPRLLAQTPEAFHAELRRELTYHTNHTGGTAA